MAEARPWLKNRALARRRPTAIVWTGIASLAGLLFGAILWLALGNALFIPRVTALFAGAVVLGTGNEDDGVDHPGPPRLY